MEKITPIAMAHRREGDDSGNAATERTMDTYETSSGELDLFMGRGRGNGEGLDQCKARFIHVAREQVIVGGEVKIFYC